MIMEVRPGLRLHSTIDSASVVVIKAPSGDVALACAGEPMSVDEFDGDQSTGPSATASDAALQLGKRYADPDHSCEFLCVKPGRGPLMVDGVEMGVLGAKPLPASD